MSIFDNINFNEYSLLEGQQAEEYKARKAKEKEDNMKKEYERRENRYGISSKNTVRNHKDFYSPDNKASIEKRKRAKDVSAANDNGFDAVKYSKAKRSFNRVRGGELEARDAASRHARRHAKHESVIAMIEAYECEYNY